MSTDEYVPSEDEMVSGLVQIPGEPAGIYRHVRVDEMKRGLARVRRDAAREQFENFIANMQTMHDGTHLHAAQIVYAEVIRMAEVYAKVNFPEESP